MWRWSSPTRKSPRCVTPTASSACWTPRRVRPRMGGKLEKPLLLTRFDPARAARGEMLKVEDVLEILAIPLLGIVPESAEVLTASNLGCPVTLNNPASAPARADLEAARRLLGEKREVITPIERRGLMSRIFGRKAMA